MTNQAPPILGYRQLTADEVALINEIKAAGAQLAALVDRVETRAIDYRAYAADAGAADVLAGLEDAQPLRWVSIARTDLQKGLMALARAVARPVGF